MSMLILPIEKHFSPNKGRERGWKERMGRERLREGRGERGGRERG